MSKRQFFRINDLSGGLNPDQNPVLIADNEASDVLNVRFDKAGSLVSRDGYARYVDEATLFDIVALGRWNPADDPSGAHVLAVVAGGGGSLAGDESILAGDESILAGDAGSSSFASLVRVTAGYPELWSGLTVTTAGEFLAVDNGLIFTNGQDHPIIYDGTTAHEMGMEPPDTAPTLTEAATGGTLDAALTYAYTYYDSNLLTESNPSPTASITPNASGRTVVVSDLPGTHPRADKVRIYRTDLAGSLLNFLVELPIATTSYDDTGAVATDTQNPLEYDNDAPLSFESLAYHKGFTFGNVGNILYYSKAYDPEHWPALNFIEIPFESNDTIRALWAYQDTLLIFGRSSIHLLAGSGGNWSVSRVDVDTGVVNRRSIAEVAGQLVYLAHDGLRAFPGLQPVAPKLDRVFSAMSVTDIEQATLSYVPEERSLWIGLPDGTYTVHIPNRAIGWYNLVTTFILPGGADGFSPPLFINGEKRYVNLYTGSTDVGAAIPISWRSKIYQLDNPETTKFIRRIGAFASAGSDGIVTISIADNQQTATVTLSSTAAGDSAEWAAADDAEGTAPLWDAFEWESEGLEYFVGALPAQRLFGHTMTVTITGDVTQRTEVVPPITFEYREANRFLGR